MGELKNIREQQETLIARAKDANQKLYLAGLGAYSKAEENSSELFDKYVTTGTQALGEKAEGKPKALLAGRGLLQAARELVDSAPEKSDELYQKFISAGRKQRGEKAEGTNEYVLAGLGAVLTAREEGEKFFNELVAEGEKRA
jgi:polyhydroxyalkanoate synthesis regulator phasin